jgi:RNA polymerase sigma factor (sigma-70 family)
MNTARMWDSYILYDKAILRLAYSYYNHPLVQEDTSLQIDDLTQEISLAWYKAYQTYNKDRGTVFNTHFHTVAHNHMRDFLRRLMSNTQLPKYVPLAEASHIEAPDLIGDMERSEAIQAILNNHLSAREAQMVLLYFGIGMEAGSALTQEEIATEFGVSQQRVEQIINGALSNPTLVSTLQEEFL